MKCLKLLGTICSSLVLFTNSNYCHSVDASGAESNNNGIENNNINNDNMRYTYNNLHGILRFFEPTEEEKNNDDGDNNNYINNSTHYNGIIGFHAQIESDEQSEDAKTNSVIHENERNINGEGDNNNYRNDEEENNNNINNDDAIDGNNTSFDMNNLITQDNYNYLKENLEKTISELSCLLSQNNYHNLHDIFDEYLFSSVVSSLKYNLVEELTELKSELELMLNFNIEQCYITEDSIYYIDVQQLHDKFSQQNNGKSYNNIYNHLQQIITKLFLSNYVAYKSENNILGELQTFSLLNLAKILRNLSGDINRFLNLDINTKDSMPYSNDKMQQLSIIMQELLAQYNINHHYNINQSLSLIV